MDIFIPDNIREIVRNIIVETEILDNGLRAIQAERKGSNFAELAWLGSVLNKQASKVDRLWILLRSECSKANISTSNAMLCS